MFELIQKMLIGLLTGLVNGSNHTKCISLSNQKCMIQPTIQSIISVFQYPFAVKLDKCVGSCNTLNDLSNKVCIPNKTEDLNINMFNMITRINESKTLKHISCDSKCKPDGTKCNWNNNKCRC